MVSCASSRQRGVGWDGKSVGMLCMRNRKARPWAQRRPQSQTTLPRTETHTPIIIGKKSPETYLLAKRAKDYESHSIDWCDHFRNEEKMQLKVSPTDVIFSGICYSPFRLFLRDSVSLFNVYTVMESGNQYRTFNHDWMQIQRYLRSSSSSSPLMKDLPKTGSAREDLPTGV
jgi:hypothetical protein